MIPILENLGLQLGVKSQYNGPSGQLTLFFGNKSPGNLERLVANVPPAQQFQIQMQPLPDSIAPRKQIQVSRLQFLWFLLPCKHLHMSSVHAIALSVYAFPDLRCPGNSTALTVLSQLSAKKQKQDASEQEYSLSVHMKIRRFNAQMR